MLYCVRSIVFISAATNTGFIYLFLCLFNPSRFEISLLWKTKDKQEGHIKGATIFYEMLYRHSRYPEDKFCSWWLIYFSIF